MQCLSPPPLSGGVQSLFPPPPPRGVFQFISTSSVYGRVVSLSLSPPGGGVQKLSSQLLSFSPPFPG